MMPPTTGSSATTVPAEEDLRSDEDLHPETLRILEAQAAAGADPELSPETGSPFSKATVARYLVAFTLFGVLNNAAFGITSTVLLPQHITDLGIGNPEAAFATVTSIASIVSLVAGLVWGSLSDRTRSPLGRRAPWILIGCLVAGLGLYLLGSMVSTASITLTYCFLILGQNALQTPLIAYLSDRVPQKVRGTLSVGFGATTIGAPIGSMVGSAFIGQSYMWVGFIVGGAFMALSGLVPLAILPREPSAVHYPAPERDTTVVTDLLKSFAPPRFSTAHDFYRALAGRFFMFMSYQMIVQYQLYIVQNYLQQDVAESAHTIQVMSIITLVVSVVGTLGAGPLSDISGRRKLPILIASALFVIGTIIPWAMPTPMGMYLYVGIAGLGYGAYLSVDQALNVDVLPDKENAGKNLGFINVATTFGLTVAPLLTSLIVTSTGSYVAAFPVSIAGALIGAFFIARIRTVR